MNDHPDGYPSLFHSPWFWVALLGCALFWAAVARLLGVL